MNWTGFLNCHLYVRFVLYSLYSNVALVEFNLKRFKASTKIHHKSSTGCVAFLTTLLSIQGGLVELVVQF